MSTLPPDSTRLSPRTFDAERLAAYRQEGDYQYQEPPVPDVDPSWWKQLLRQIAELLSSEGASVTIRLLIYLTCAAALAFVILRLFGVEVGSLFRRPSRAAGSTPLTDHVDVRTLDFDALLQAAWAERNYAQAVRLFYLAALRHLTDTGRIRWEMGKTHRDYRRELRASQTAALPAFDTLGQQFAYVRYGNFPATAQTAQRARAAFDDLYQL